MMCGFSDTRLGRSISFQYMRTLECAIRHLSFQKAAQELGITPSAVSQQIKKLEQQCGVQFFERLPNQLVLTTTAKACFEYLHQGMRMLTIATNQIENIRAETLIRISAAPSGGCLSP